MHGTHSTTKIEIGTALSKNGGGRPGPFHHVDGLSVYPGLTEEASLRLFLQPSVRVLECAYCKQS